MTRHLNRYERLILGADNHLGPVVLYLLLWVAHTQQPPDSRKLSLIKDISHDLEAGPLFEDVAALAGKGRADYLELSVQLARELFDPPLAEGVAEMAVQVAVVDGRLTVAENYSLRFLADALGGPDLVTVFERVTGRELPDPSDISRASWWAGYDRRGTGRSPRANDPARSEALAVLGLDETASPDDIRQAFRQLARRYHPDKVATQDEQVTAQATAAFRRIRSAYETLRG